MINFDIASIHWIKGLLHGRAVIQNFSSSVGKIFSRVSTANEQYIFQHKKRNFVSPSNHVIFF